jgi:hypothetical protein
MPQGLQQPQGQPQLRQTIPGQPGQQVPPSAAVAGVTQSEATAAPGSTASGDAGGEAVKKTRKPRAPKEKYVGRDAAGNPAKLETPPTDWSGKKHLPLSKDDFASEAVFYDFKAMQAAKQSDKYKQLAADCRLGGDSETRKLKKKADKLRETVSDNFAKLAERLGPDAVKELLQRLVSETGAALHISPNGATAVQPPMGQPAGQQANQGTPVASMPNI